MANTTVSLTNEDGILVPSQTSVAVASGDTVTFTAGEPAYLFFSPAAKRALSPAPSSPFLLNKNAEFTFTTSDEAEYSVFFETASTATPPPFPIGTSATLRLEIDPTGAGFGGPDKGTKPGSRN